MKKKSLPILRKNRLPIRLLFYFGGLFILTAGIALSVKAKLGVSPVSSVPYMFQLVLKIEMGKATILIHTFLILFQIILLRKQFKWKNLLQLPVGIVFGYFTTFCNWAASFLPSTDNYFIRFLLMLLSTVLIAFAIFLYVPANIISLANEGAIKAVSDKTGMAFSTIKTCYDILMVTIALTCCLIFTKELGSVGVGTIITALVVGSEIALFNKGLGKYRDKILKGEPAQK